MDNNSYRSQYIQSDTENMSDQSTQAVVDFWKRVGRAEQQLEICLEDGYSSENFIRLIEKLNITNINPFIVAKCRIGKYLKWLHGQDLLMEEYVDSLYSVDYSKIQSDRIYDLKYFKDFKSLQDTIETTLWAAEKIDDNVFAAQISAVYLAWCGLKLENSLQIKKDDVYDDRVDVAGLPVFPNPDIMHHLVSFRDATEYQSQGRGIITLKYTPSVWLFRSARSAHVDSTKTFRIFIRNFGKSGGEDVNMFNYDKVYWSGIFNRAYMHEVANGDIQPGDVSKMEMLFGEKYASTSVANKRLKEYQRFKQYFFLSSK